MPSASDPFKAARLERLERDLARTPGTTMPSQVGSSPVVSLAEFEEAAQHVSRHAYHTPLLTSRLLSERTGFDMRLKAEMFRKGGSYKVRGPLNKFRHLTAEQRRRGVICSSAGNHAQGVAIAAAVYKMKAVVVMASNATQSKVEATRAYGAEVVQHGTIWDEANEKAKQLCEERGLTYIHPFDDMQLITGQGTLGLEVFRDFPGVDGAESVEPKDQDHWRGIVRWSSDAAERRSRPRHHAR